MTRADARRPADSLPARFGRYFRGRKLTMTSPLMPGEVERRINRSAASLLRRPHVPAVAGWARLGMVRLQVHRSLIYHCRPVLAGRIGPDGGGSRLRLNYRAPFAASILFGLWYSVLALVLFALSIAEWAAGATLNGKAMMIIHLLLFLGAPVLLLHWSTVGADEDLEQLVAFLERAAQAKPLRPLAG